jgi:hypothetical protein
MRMPSAVRTLLLSTLIALPFPAFAQSAPLPPGQTLALMGNPAVAAAVAACRGDQARLCASVLPGGGRILRCLAAQAPATSDQCKSALIQARSALAATGIVLQGLPDK